jgi:aminoglycoside/choline kinase family phosphotransferase
MGDLTIADTPEALTAEWLTDALRSSGRLGGATVRSASARPLGTGQMSDSLRVEVTYDGETDLPTTMVAKQPAADPTSRATGLSLRSYEKEVRFYQELAPTLGVSVPSVYHADIDPETGSFVLLLEDLAPAEQGDQLAGCTVEEAASALAGLVPLQATRWGDPELHATEWLAGDPDTNRAFMAMALPMFWEGFRERYANQLEPHVLAVGDPLFSSFNDYLEPFVDIPLTVVHGDYRLDNLLFRGSELRGIVDWQTVTVGGNMLDVSYFIGAGLREEDRRPNEEALVRGYYDALVAAGVSDFGWERCWWGYRRTSFAGLVMAVGASMLVEQTERGDAMFMTMAHRHCRHALDLDAPDVIDPATAPAAHR